MPVFQRLVWAFNCARCVHAWIPKKLWNEGEPLPTVCPACKSPYWNKPRKGSWPDLSDFAAALKNSPDGVNDELKATLESIRDAPNENALGYARGRLVELVQPRAELGLYCPEAGALTKENAEELLKELFA